MICRDCNVPMQPIMSFSKDKHEKFDRCPKCYEETKHKKLRDDELVFGKVLNKSIKAGVVNGSRLFKYDRRTNNNN